ncbi:MAG: hypothetical protein M0C28_23335 [Candidatus Moduliflexus flocculans]|nr:hypothetical protein [Candidatus Moduliflexus flocculans]
MSAALAEGMAGKAVTTATSRPYGCGIDAHARAPPGAWPPGGPSPLTSSAFAR